MFLILIKNIILAVILVNSAFLQSYLTQQTIKFFANHYEIELKVNNVYIKLPNKIILTEIEMLDANGDTLLITKIGRASCRERV